MTEYPPHLLPHPTYKLLVLNGHLSTNYLVRHTPDQDLIDSETGRLKLTYIVPQSDHLRDFSTNLLGIFTLSDTALYTHGSRVAYFNDLWQEGEQVEAPIFPDDFDRNDGRGYFFLLIGDLDGRTLPFQIGDGPMQRATCIVLHTPTRCNFWHFSVRWLTDLGSLEAQRGKWVERLLKTQVRTLIQQKARLEIPDYLPIDLSFYTK